MESETATQMPKYRCHKEVWALKIKSVTPIPFPLCTHPYGSTTCGYGPNERMHTGSTDPIIPPAGRHPYSPEAPMLELMGKAALISSDDPRYAAIAVSSDYMNKHKPEVGGYYVVYADGYASFSPAEAFESGYTRI